MAICSLCGWEPAYTTAIEGAQPLCEMHLRAELQRVVVDVHICVQQYFSNDYNHDYLKQADRTADEAVIIADIIEEINAAKIAAAKAAAPAEEIK